MATSKSKKKSTRSKPKRRLGRGLSSLINQPVSIVRESDTKDAVADIQPMRSEPVANKGVTNSRSGGKVTDVANSQDMTSAASGLPANVGEVNVGNAAEAGGVCYLEIESIRVNPFQPRKHMDADALSGLAQSIKSAGVMQPILVRPIAEDATNDDAAGSYEIVAGERRWRAASLAGLNTIPVLIRSINDLQSAEWALIENVQREDLDPIERAEAFRRLIDEFNLTQSQLAERVGVERSSVANLLRLLQLDENTQQEIRSGRLSQGHAKVLLSITEPEARRMFATSSIAQQWSVRELEKRIDQQHNTDASRQHASDQATSKRDRNMDKPVHIREVEQEMSAYLDLPVEIKLTRSRKSGKVIVKFANLTEFEHLMAYITSEHTNS